METLFTHFLPALQPASHYLCQDYSASINHAELACCSSSMTLPLVYNHRRDRLKINSGLTSTPTQLKASLWGCGMSSGVVANQSHYVCQIAGSEVLHSGLRQQSVEQLGLWTRVTVCRALATDEEASPVEGDEGMENLSARERRKLRNERRLENQVARREANAEKEELLMRKRTKRTKASFSELSSMEHLESEGQRWYILTIAASGEALVMEDISKGMEEAFPDVEYELFYPTIPSCQVTSRGKISTSPVKLQPGSLYIRIALSKPLYNFFRSLPRVRGFYGRKIGRGLKILVVPVPVLDKEVEERQQMVEDGYRKYEAFKEKFEREREEAKSGDKKGPGLLQAGMRIKVVKGPYQNFTGKVEELLAEKQRVMALIDIFNQPTRLELDMDQIEVATSLQ